MDAAAPMPKAQVQEALDAGERKMIGLFPGSRIQEVRKILPVLVDGVRRLDLEKVLPVVSVRPELDPALYRDAREAGFRLWDGDAASLASAADAALVASGTATLETGLTGTPMGVVYKTGRLNALIARSVIKLQTVGLVNIVAGGSRVPELLQTRLTGDAVKGLAQKLLFDPVERREQQEYLSVLPHRLGGPGASRRVAERIVQHLAEP